MGDEEVLGELGGLMRESVDSGRVFRAMVVVLSPNRQVGKGLGVLRARERGMSYVYAIRDTMGERARRRGSECGCWVRSARSPIGRQPPASVEGRLLGFKSEPRCAAATSSEPSAPRRTREAPPLPTNAHPSDRIARRRTHALARASTSCSPRIALKAFSLTAPPPCASCSSHLFARARRTKRARVRTHTPTHTRTSGPSAPQTRAANQT